jgi:hypothetical protein
VRRELERIEIPGEHDARVRSWEVVRAAFAEREPVRRRARLARPVLVLAVLAALAAAALSPPGEAVIDRLREAIGVENAEEALFSLPTGGRLLVESADGPWIVQPDGSKRRLGAYREASWSPFGRFVVVARRDELAALEPDGDVRWSLARPDVRAPRWGGTRTDTRIAYRSRDGLRVVAGDGEGDREACARVVAPVAPAWRPGLPHTLAFVAPGEVVEVYETDRCRQLLRVSVRGARSLTWSADGSRLLVVARDRLLVYERGRPRPVDVTVARGVTQAELSPDGRRLARLVVRGERSELFVEGRLLFTGPGRFTDLAWAPDGSLLLVAWKDADQWVFVPTDGRGSVRAVSGISAQFGGSFPRVAGWCCPR